ncbi:MAG: HAD-IIIA family hydrolase [Nitrospirota bacterium]
MLSIKQPFDTLFLDRDGVLNRKIDDGYVLHPSEIEILPGITEFLAWAGHVFSRIVVVTNQRCVGRGLLTISELNKVNSEINKQTGSWIDKFYVCTHLNEDACSCRKPQKGLFLRATEEFNICLNSSLMIGDSETDLIPAKEMGLSTIYISAGTSPYADVTIKLTTELLPLLSSTIEG